MKHPPSDTHYDLWFRQAAEQDDRQAFGRLFRAMYKDLCAYAYRYAASKEDAEEIVSEVFLKLWNCRKEVHLTASVRYFLIVCVRNKSVDHVRKESKWRKTDLAELAVASSDADAHRQMSGREALQAVHRLIEQLPPQCQAVFCLSRFDGLKYDEIADRMGISVKTVETQMSRALRKLREGTPAWQVPG